MYFVAIQEERLMAEVKLLEEEGDRDRQAVVDLREKIMRDATSSKRYADRNCTRLRPHTSFPLFGGCLLLYFCCVFGRLVKSGWRLGLVS